MSSRLTLTLALAIFAAGFVVIAITSGVELLLAAKQSNLYRLHRCGLCNPLTVLMSNLLHPASVTKCVGLKR